ncbi:MAG: oligosaccharide flippase family protein [Porphyromonadaceae bacterium]|nr:oligosaccharide flippase family protein [Porphyromonadaceae bacterium]
MNPISRGLLRDIGRLLLSGVVSQGIALLLLIFIGRQYKQDAIGMQGLMLSWSGILTTIIMGRYEQAIVIARTEERATRLWHICLILGTLGSGVVGIAAWIIDLLWEGNPLKGFIHWIAPYVLITAITNATMMLLLRQKAYTRLCIAQGLRTISNNLLKVLLGTLYPTTLSLISSTFVASIIGAIPLWQRLRFALSQRWDKRYKIYLKYYKAFPLFSTPQALLNTLIGSLLVIMLPLSYGLKEIGTMTMIMMLVRRPLLVLSDSVGQVYFERMSRLVSNSSSPMPLIKNLIGITLLGWLTVYAIVYFTIDWSIPRLLGMSWTDLPQIIVWMIPYLGANFLASILNVLPDILGRQRVDLAVRLIRLGLESSIIFIGMRLYPFEIFVRYYYLLLFILELLYVGLLIYLPYSQSLRLSREHRATRI